MVHIEGEIVINRPVEEVFDVVAEERNEPRYNPRLLWVEKISSGPVERGTQYRAATKTIGRPVEMTIEFIDYERPRRLASLTHIPTMEIRGALTFDPVPEGTKMRWSWELQPRGVLRLLRPLIARMGERRRRPSGPASSSLWRRERDLPHPHRMRLLQVQRNARRSWRPLPTASREMLLMSE
jgi:hypothetical protein